jgi:hypothetical protein
MFTPFPRRLEPNTGCHSYAVVARALGAAIDLTFVRELIVIEVLHTSLLDITVVAFKVLPLGSYAPMPAPSPPFQTILEMVLWNGLQSCRRITPDVISVIKIPPFNISFIFGNRNSHWEIDPVNRDGVPAQIFVY